MKAPDIRKLMRDDIDLKTDQGIDQLFNILNIFNEQVSLALDGNLTLGENVTGKVLEASFTTGASFVPFTVPVSGSTISSVSIGFIQNVDNPSEVITNAVTLTSWTQLSKQLKINYVTGLAANTRYKIRLLIL